MTAAGLVDRVLREEVDALEPPPAATCETLWLEVLTRAAPRPASPRRRRAVVAALAFAALVPCAAAAVETGVIQLPGSLRGDAGTEPPSSSPVATEVGADGAITLVADSGGYRFVRIASTSAVGGVCYGIRPAGGDAFSAVECPETEAAARSDLLDMTAWHQQGMRRWAGPIRGFVGPTVARVEIDTAGGQVYDLAVVNRVYAYDGDLDAVTAIRALDANGAEVAAATAIVLPPGASS
jgi:hypothetical protein